ncbi:phosphoethanolamine transferase [Hydrogenophaga electricum]|uniref:Phosphoethanolamine--lipid A transferase EptA n=1 Tax=Hydrogenophaga electricum TaxID=1230953 RepID=A0ABQ6C6W9_9BURK|nr:phosphoethanolamine--lipid A transferase [Hydrogenophaga electricum]GLS16098.1 phosphoethanolamine--lipid A transferase EptA [Hydrogenophaga electricum]
MALSISRFSAGSAAAPAPDARPSGVLRGRFDVLPGAPVLVLALWLTLTGNLPLWQRIGSLDGSLAFRLGGSIGLGLLIGCLNLALLALLAWPRVWRPAATVLILVTALAGHFMAEYGVVIDTSMLVNALQTDTREVRDLLSLRLLLTVLGIAGPALWWVWRRPPTGATRWWRQATRNAGTAALAPALVVLAAVLSYSSLASLMRNHKPLRYMANPLASVYAIGRLALDQAPTPARTLTPVGTDAHVVLPAQAHRRPALLMLVVGETARAENFGLDGYPRDTTPALARWQAAQAGQGQGSLVNFADVQSCGTNTQVSVPCLFSPLSREEGGNQPPTQENLLDVLQRAGLAVLWLDNQSGCKGVCDRVPHASTRELNVPGLCEGGECLDEVMLQDLDARIAALDPQRREKGVVVVLHQMGSHGPAYFKRAPAAAKRFLPECESNTLSDCTPEALRNTYDNSIAYTDHVLDLGLQWLQAQAQGGRYDTGLLYVSDHGESLGENGLYLHGLPYALAPSQQTHVPMVMWLSDALQERTGIDGACLRRQTSLPLSHDNVFHSVLGLMQVHTLAHLPALDITAPCGQASPLAREDTRGAGLG